MSTWIGQSFAKINVGLQVLARLPNGYHVLETGMMYINWADRFEIKAARKTELAFSDLSIPTDHTNLVAKALVLLRGAGLKGDYDINVKKKIPAGAGLGGGSSNAAFTLRAFNEIEQLGLSQAELHEFAAKLGSDVPFFLDQNDKLATGTGTRLQPKAIRPADCYVVTAFPGVHSSTADAYADCEPMHDRLSLSQVLAMDVEEDWPLMLVNDLEPPVIARLPEVGLFKDRMMEMGAFYSAMSGSGSSVFGLFTQDFVAAEATASFIQLGYAACLTEPDFSPDQRLYARDID